MSVLKRVAVTAAATTLVAATVATGGPASAAPIKIKGKVTGTSTIAKTGDTLRLPKGSTLRAGLKLAKAKIVNGSLEVPTITAHMNAKIPGLPLPGVPTTAKVNMVQTKPIKGKIFRKGPNRGHVKTVAYTRLAIPKVTLDVPIPILNGVNIVQNTCTTKPFKISMLSENKFSLNGRLHVKPTFTIPAFDKCDIVNIPPLDLRDSLLTQLLSGPGNKLNLKIGPMKLDKD